MKASANHPSYIPTKISCSCGVVYDTFSTKGDFQVEVCSACHPFYTGKQKILDAAGRVERFNRKYGRKTAGAEEETAAPAAEAAPATDTPAADNS
jgi:large subunit ribosomal protein L31